MTNDNKPGSSNGSRGKTAVAADVGKLHVAQRHRPINNRTRQSLTGHRRRSREWAVRLPRRAFNQLPRGPESLPGRLSTPATEDTVMTEVLPMPDADTGKQRVRLAIPAEDHDALRVVAAKSGVSMSLYAERSVLDALREGRVLKSVSLSESTGRVLVRLALPQADHVDLRVNAAKSGVSMARYAEVILIENIRKGRVLKGE